MLIIHMVQHLGYIPPPSWGSLVLQSVRSEWSKAVFGAMYAIVHSVLNDATQCLVCFYLHRLAAIVIAGLVSIPTLCPSFQRTCSRLVVWKRWMEGLNWHDGGTTSSTPHSNKRGEKVFLMGSGNTTTAQDVHHATSQKLAVFFNSYGRWHRDYCPAGCALDVVSGSLDQPVTACCYFRALWWQSYNYGGREVIALDLL